VQCYFKSSPAGNADPNWQTYLKAPGAQLTKHGHLQAAAQAQAQAAAMNAQAAQAAAQAQAQAAQAQAAQAQAAQAQAQAAAMHAQAQQAAMNAQAQQAAMNAQAQQAAAAAVAATIREWIPVGASDNALKGEKCGPEHLTEDAVRQAFKCGQHIGYYQANGVVHHYILLAIRCSHRRQM
jgi:membrane protein involved in colicin uptake